MDSKSLSLSPAAAARQRFPSVRRADREPLPLTGDDRLRQFCTAVLALLGAASTTTALPATLCEELTQLLGVSVGGMADKLREELRVCDETIRQLAALEQSRYFTAGNTAALLDELRQTRSVAAPLIAALDALHGACDSSAAPPRIPVSRPRPMVPLRGTREKDQEHPRIVAPAVRRLRLDDPPPEAPLPTATSLPTPTPTPKLERAAPVKETAPETPSSPVARKTPAPAPLPSASAAQMLAGKVEVKCPHCEEAGMVNWDRLNKIIVCKHCSRKFGVKPDGKAIKMTQTADGRWMEDAPRKTSGGGISVSRRRLLASAAVAGLLVLAAGTALHMSHASSPPAEKPLPVDLKPRAELFTRAWLRNDVPLMRRLTTPTHDRILNSWSLRHQPPALSGEGGKLPDNLTLELAVLSSKPHLTVFLVRVEGQSQAGEPSLLEMKQTWEERGDSWYFIPPPR